MRTICLYFQIHQPFRFRKYRFFEIGNEHYYYDDYLNESIMRKVTEKCYLPANSMILQLINKYKGKFKLSFSISGVALDQFELYAPEVIDSFRELAKPLFSLLTSLIRLSRIPSSHSPEPSVEPSSTRTSSHDSLVEFITSLTRRCSSGMLSFSLKMGAMIE